jgi:hypothetical protein
MSLRNFEFLKSFARKSTNITLRDYASSKTAIGRSGPEGQQIS